MSIVTGQTRKFCAVLLGLLISSSTLANEGEDTRKPEPPAEEESPWLLTPTISSDPKLGTTLGFVAGYIPSFPRGPKNDSDGSDSDDSDSDEEDETLQVLKSKRTFLFYTVKT